MKTPLTPESAEAVGVTVLELMPNGMTKVDLGNDQRKHYMFEKGVLEELADRLGCDCQKCQQRRANEKLNREIHAKALAAGFSDQP